jgi:hypothetical protein|tara:strand:+ start:62 stop:235 length:174 start_codon:yes stop_codon:yes gene_type:complete
MNEFTSPFLAKNPLNEKQSLETKYREFKAKVSGKIRRILGEANPPPKKLKNIEYTGQ